MQTTFYGDKWLLGAGGDKDAYQRFGFNDLAYTTAALAVHNDGTYWSQPPGIQVHREHLHCAVNRHRNSRVAITIVPLHPGRFSPCKNSYWIPW